MSKGCTPTSSSCVIWNGPNIPCLDQCRGDSIEDIVYKLSEIVCALAEAVPSDCDCENKITSQIFNCYNSDLSINTGIPAFSLTTEQLLETLFSNFICVNGEYDIIYQDVLDKIKLISQPLALSDCLQYTEEGQLVTELTYDQYILLIAQHVCDLYDLLSTQNNDITSLQDDITIIQNWINNYIEPTKLTITSQCASAPTPGETVEIDLAFETLETHYCDYITTLGSTTDWINAIGNMCPKLATEPQMQDLSLDMEDLPTWINNPTNVAENYSNMWATICDLRVAMQTILTNQSLLPCVLAVPENLTIDSYNITSAELSWDISSLTNIQAPIGFLLEIYEWNGISQGNLIYSNSYAGNVFTATVTSGNIIALETYLVKLSAVYSCGQSSYVTTSGVLKDVSILYQINVSEVSDSGITTDCDNGGGAVAYNYITNTVTLDLILISTGLPATLASDLTSVVKFTVNHPDYGTFTHNVAITIPAGDSTVNYEYVSEQTILSNLGTCEKLTESITCGVVINNNSCEFGTGIVEC